MTTLEYIVAKYELDLDQGLPIEIPDTGRDTLARIYRELGFKVGAEIGVEAGLYSEVLCRENPTAHLYCIDSWLQYAGYRTYVPQERVDGFFLETLKRLRPYNSTVIKSYSADAVKLFDDNSLDFVFLDGNHSYDYVLEDINLWSKKVKHGGIISGHDYIKRAPPSTHDVIGAVNFYTKTNNINPWFLLGRKEKRKGEIRDQSRTWFFVK